MFAGQRVAEHAGRPVTAGVHGTIVDGHGGAAERGGTAASDQRELGPRPVTAFGLRLGGHAHVVAGRPAVGGRRPGRRPAAIRRRPRRAERRGRGGRGGHRTTVSLRRHDGVRRRGPPIPVRGRHVFRHVVVPLRRDGLHRLPAAAAHQLVIVRHREPRPLGVRPHRETGSVHCQAVELFASQLRRRPEAHRSRRFDRRRSSAALYRFVRLPVHGI